ncbi:MAG TPA: hypothetical protein VFI61_02635 [Patescibacteria group bacterium]|nr:hypothetical protein [Patescibacteria group bacterium]
MRKELLWAGIIGISFGLVIAFGVWRVNSSLKTKNISIKNTPQPKANASAFQITLNKPENNDVIVENSTTVSGITKPLSWLTVSGEDEDYIIQTDEQGVFSQDVNLISGVNQIKITAFDNSGNQSIEKVLVVYSSAFQTRAVETPAPDASGDASIRQKVVQKVEELLNKPKAYIGVVTDITDSTIQIKTLESEIKQISTSSDDIAVIKVGTTTKTVKLTDISIGDFVVAMGYVNSSSVLSAQRILITSPITEPKITATLGKISDIDEVVANKKTTLAKAVKTKMLKIAENDQIIFVTAIDNDSPIIRSIFVIQKS